MTFQRPQSLSFCKLIFPIFQLHTFLVYWTHEKVQFCHKCILSAHISIMMRTTRHILKGDTFVKQRQYLHKTVVAENWQIMFQNTICEVYKVCDQHSLFCLSYPNNVHASASWRISSCPVFFIWREAAQSRHRAIQTVLENSRGNPSSTRLLSAFSLQSRDFTGNHHTETLQAPEITCFRGNWHTLNFRDHKRTASVIQQTFYF